MYIGIFTDNDLSGIKSKFRFYLITILLYMSFAIYQMPTIF